MELVLQSLSAHAFIMAHHTHKDTCCSKDAAFGEVVTVMTRSNHIYLIVFWVLSSSVSFSVCMGGVWNCTETNCSGLASFHGTTTGLRVQLWLQMNDCAPLSPFPTPPAECSVIGDVFVTTFDGRIFLQPGACHYVLAKSRGSKFTVTLQYTTCAEVRTITRAGSRSPLKQCCNSH